MTYSLEVVQEELLVAQDELAAQQSQIEELLARERETRTTGDDLLTVLPVAVVVSDATGSIERANPRAVALLERPARRLIGKPLPTLVDLDSRRTLRTLVSDALTGAEASARVRFPSGEDEQRFLEVSVAALDGPGARRRLHWVFRETRAGEPQAGWGAGALADAVTALARTPLGEVPLHQVLVRSTQLAVEAVEAADWASASVGDPRRPEEVGTSDVEAQRADGVQWAGGTGPTQEAYDGGVEVGSADLHHDARWPNEGWLATPVRSALALPFSLDEGVTGVLTLYGRRPGALHSGTGDGPAQVFAAATGAALLGARRVAEHRLTAEQLTRAMASRSTIEQAKGLIVGALGCSPEEAFAAMAAVSQHRNVKLRDLATELLTAPGREDLLPALRSESGAD